MQSRICLVAALLCLLGQTKACANDPYYDPRSVLRTQGYLLDLPDIQQSSETNFTETRHHRFGQQTGIGSSYLQTQSATTEDQPAFMYRPTALSPVVPTGVSPAFRGAATGTYSQILSSPALSSLESASPALSNSSAQSPLILAPALENVSPPALKSFSFYGHKQPAGGELGRQLLDPMKGL
jgi:hypothetical protein